MKKQTKAVKREQNRKRQMAYRQRKMANGWREKKVWVKGKEQEETLSFLIQADCAILGLIATNFDSFADWAMKTLDNKEGEY